MTDRHRRELRRLRTDEVRYGLTLLSGLYRDALVAGTTDRRAAVAAVEALRAASENLVRNPNEALLLQALLLRLPPLETAGAEEARSSSGGATPP